MSGTQQRLSASTRRAAAGASHTLAAVGRHGRGHALAVDPAIVGDRWRVLGSRAVLALQQSIGNGAATALVAIDHTHERPPPRSGAGKRSSTEPHPGALHVQRATGLGQAGDVAQFAQVAQQRWTTRRAQNPDDGLWSIAGDLIAEVAVHLRTHYGIPRLDSGEDTSGSSGEFRPSTWALFVNPVKLARGGGTTIGTVTPSQLENIVDTVYHEARHCEQFFRVARLMAARSDQPAFRKADDISAKLGIPIDIAEAAARAPLTDASAEAHAEAEDWESVMTGNLRAYAALVYGLLRVTRAAYAHAKRIRHDVTAEVEALPQLEAAMQRLDDYQRYQIAEERQRLAREPSPDIQARLTKMANGIQFSSHCWEAFQQGGLAIDALIGGLDFLERFVYDAYENLPHEQDAWTVGAMAKTEFTRLQSQAIPARSRKHRKQKERV